MVLRRLAIIEQILAELGCVLRQALDFTCIKLASQAERAGSIPATRSTLCHKALSLFPASQNQSSFTGGFTLPVAASAFLSMEKLCHAAN